MPKMSARSKPLSAQDTRRKKSATFQPLPAKDIIANVEKRLAENRDIYKTRVGEKLDRLVYWSSLVLLALLNFVACFFLIPFLMFLEGIYLYAAVACLGLMFGFLFNLLILGIEHLEHKHTIIAGIFMPLLAVLDISLILNISEKISSLLVRPITYNVPMVVMVFIFSFILPYLISVLSGRHKL
jgi:hypothetical protein